MAAVLVYGPIGETHVMTTPSREMIVRSFEETFLPEGFSREQYFDALVELSEASVAHCKQQLDELKTLVEKDRTFCGMASAYFHYLLNPKTLPGDLEPLLAPTQAHLEFLQLLCLTGHLEVGTPAETNINWLEEIETGRILLETTIAIWMALGIASSFSHYARSADLLTDATKIQLGSQTDASVIRNFAWPAQLEEVHLGVLELLASRKTKVDSLSIYRFLGGIIGLIENKLNRHYGDLRSIYSNYQVASAIPGLAVQLPDWFEQANLDEYLGFMRGFQFSLNELESIATSLDIKLSVTETMRQLSLSPGELSHENLSHCISQNPVTLQPFLQVEQHKWACFTPGTLHSFRFEQTSRVLKQSGDGETLAWARKEYLEQQVPKMVSLSIPDRPQYVGVILRNEATKTVVGEGDLVMPMGQILLIVECKSAEVTPQARRGSPDRLEKWLNEQALVGSTQLSKLENVILRGDGELNSKLAQIRSHLAFAPDVLCLGVVVCMEPPSFLDSRSTDLVHSGVVDGPIRPVLSIFELQAAVELFATPYQFIHYLWKRSVWEERSQISGDGFDLLGLYLGNPTFMSDGPIHLMMTSLEVDRQLNLPVDRRSRSFLTSPSRSFWDQVVRALWESGSELLALALLDIEESKQMEINKYFLKISRKLDIYFKRSKGILRQWEAIGGIKLAVGFRANVDVQQIGISTCIVLLDPSMGLTPVVMGSDRVKVVNLDIIAT